MPHDTNQYAIILLRDPGAHAGALDEYEVCQYLPVTNPATGTDCYAGDVNRYAEALLAGSADAGDLDKYEKCQFLPFERTEPSEG